ncbi:unnamed protein product [Meganyctiphanes norvegica]|uniref:Uncharacterized protein n=1 Tax=Meganyctiphanes norvegica TaxID=48144 RepID=A0AAV2PI89_MEGNR
MNYNSKYLMAYSGICRFIQIVFLTGVHIATALSGKSLGWSCRIFVHIGSGLVMLSVVIYIVFHVLKPTKSRSSSTRWQEGLHDGLSALLLLVVSTVLLLQDINIPIGVAVFLSLSCALCIALQGFSNFSLGRQSRIKDYLGLYKYVSPEKWFNKNDDSVWLCDEGGNNNNEDDKPITFTITSDDDVSPLSKKVHWPLVDHDRLSEDAQSLQPPDLDTAKRPLPTITINDVDEEEKTPLHDASEKLNEYKKTLIAGVGATPEQSDRSGMSEYHTPQETPTGNGNTRVAAATAVTPWDPTAFSTPPDHVPGTPTLISQDLLIDVDSPDIIFDIKPIRK